MRTALILLTACGPAAGPTNDTAAPPRSAPPGAENVLIVVIDDVGIDKVGAYGEHPDAPPTPNMDALAADGVRFTHAYAHPTCSPTRAALLTGQYASRTGIGTWVDPWKSETSLDPGAVILPEVVRASPHHVWADAALGKWHLTSFLSDDPAMHPLDAGFSHHRGSLGNPSNALVDSDRGRGFFYWEKAVDGVVSYTDTYMTVDTVDDALSLMDTLPEPWLLYVAFNAAHVPLHVPPDDLRPHPLPDAPTDADLFAAMVVALDLELGRLVDGMEDRTAAPTTVMLIGDNGTPQHAILPPLDPFRCKGTVSEGGVRVPFIVTGPRVAEPGTVSGAPVHVVDVFPTVAEIAGVDPTTLVDADGEPVLLDGWSLLPALQGAPAPRLLYSEQFGPNGPPPYTWFGRTIRDDRHKLIRSGLGDALFALGDGLDEGDDLLAAPLDADAAAAFDALSAAMDAIDQRW